MRKGARDDFRAAARGEGHDEADLPACGYWAWAVAAASERAAMMVANIRMVSSEVLMLCGRVESLQSLPFRRSTRSTESRIHKIWPLHSIPVRAEVSKHERTSALAVHPSIPQGERI
jgi:hypothetical protein